MKAWQYNRLVREYKRRVAMNKSIEKDLNDETFIGYYRKQAEKKYRINKEVAADLLVEIKRVRKEDIIYA